eukprot:EG_transcript_28425
MDKGGQKVDGVGAGDVVDAVNASTTLFRDMQIAANPVALFIFVPVHEATHSSLPFGACQAKKASRCIPMSASLSCSTTKRSCWTVTLQNCCGSYGDFPRQT